MPYPELAGFRDEGAVAALVGLFAGDAPIVTDSAPALAALAQFQVCVLLPTGATPYVAATHGAAVPDKLCVAMVATASGAQATLWVAGYFNHEKLVWPAGVNTLALRKELVKGSGIFVGHAKPSTAPM